MTTIKPRTTIVVLFQGDDLDPIEERRAAIESAVVSVSAPKRLGDDVTVKTSTQEYNDFLDGAVARAVKVELHHIGRTSWRDMVRRHPPRTTAVTTTSPDGSTTVRQEVNEQDETWGFNFETLCDELVPESFHAATSDTPENVPDVKTAAKVKAFLEDLSDGDFSRLYSAAVLLNQSVGPDPKARISWPDDQTSGETSESPARLG